MLITTLALFCLVCVPAAMAIPSIEYSLTKMDGDTWQYDYYMSDIDLTKGQTITIYFDVNFCTEITPINDLSDSGWGILALQPDPEIWDGGADGSYNATALIDDPADSGPFSVQFSWLNNIAPGVQSFDLFNSDFVDPIGSGLTVLRGGPDVPAVPEPASGLLLLGGLGLLAGAARLRQRK